MCLDSSDVRVCRLKLCRFRSLIVVVLARARVDAH
jgi:hypothetical protein